MQIKTTVRYHLTLVRMPIIKKSINKTWNWKWKMLSLVQLFAIPCTLSHQAPLSMEFSRPEYWSGFSSVQSLSCVQLFETPWTTAHQASLSITNSPEVGSHSFLQGIFSTQHVYFYYMYEYILLLQYIPETLFSKIPSFSTLYCY